MMSYIHNVEFPCHINIGYSIYLSCKIVFFHADSTAIHDQRYGEGSGPYLLSYVNCRGHEQNLTECPSSQIGFHRCSSKQDAGVICDG